MKSIFISGASSLISEARNRSPHTKSIEKAVGFYTAWSVACSFAAFCGCYYLIGNARGGLFSFEFLVWLVIFDRIGLAGGHLIYRFRAYKFALQESKKENAVLENYIRQNISVGSPVSLPEVGVDTAIYYLEDLKERGEGRFDFSYQEFPCDPIQFRQMLQSHPPKYAETKRKLIKSVDDLEAPVWKKIKLDLLNVNPKTNLKKEREKASLDTLADRMSHT